MSKKKTTWIVSKEESGQKLVTFLRTKLEGKYSARQLKKALEHNFCQVNNQIERFGSYEIHHEDSIEFDLSAEELFVQRGLKVAPHRILYSDDNILAYDKPPGVVSDEPSFIKILKEGLPALFLIHRLDRDTTGVLLFAKNELMKESLENLFRNREIKKSYLALVDGVMKEPHGLIDNYLGPKRKYKGQTVYGETSKEQGQRAITEWQLLSIGKEISYVQCVPLTGRTHQLRVHLSMLGHPILGDYQYTRQFRCAYRPPRCLLHAHSLTFRHPSTNEIITIKAPIPKDFDDAIKLLIRKQPYG